MFTIVTNYSNFDSNWEGFSIQGYWWFKGSHKILSTVVKKILYKVQRTMFCEKFAKNNFITPVAIAHGTFFERGQFEGGGDIFDFEGGGVMWGGGHF